MRPKKKQGTVVGNPGRDINQNNGNCKDYRQKLEEYRKGLYNLNRPENCQHSECGGECIEFDEKGCEICESNRENFRACDMSRGRNHDCPRRDAKESDSGRGFRESQFIRNSMHWEEFFGSSLELAPSLLSIFDSIASANRSPDQDGTDQSDHSPRSREDPTNQNQAQELPTIKVDAENCNHSVTMDPCRNDLDTNDNKKRPLSISSMSSTSSSSLPRHTNKRPNLTGKNSNNSLQERMESKLDNILYIDDDVPNGVTDDEMSVDTDCENNKKCEQDSSSNDPQSDKSLSSNDNLSKSDEVRQPLAEVSSNDLDLSNKNEDSMNKSIYCNGSSAASTPGSSFYETPDTSTTSISSPALQGQGQTPSPSSGTPSRQSSLRDSTSPQKYVSRVQRVVAEIVETERTYVTHLKEIIEGYMKFLVSSNQQYISKKETVCLFGNIEEIYEFSSAVEVLTKVMKDPVLSEKFKQQQLSLGHNLPLGAYLLKPVQRVLKYHLLLHNILKNFDKSDPRYSIVSEALDHMTMRAQHMNEMKRKHEHAVRVQEIQSTLEDYEGEDLTRLGELVLEGSFRTYGAKTSRHVFLFEKGVLIAKRKENAMLSCKIFIMCSNLMLVESLPKEPLSFQVIPFDNPKGQHVLMARNMDQKRKWCQEVKRLILESYKGKIPEKVKGLVMQLGKSKTDDSPDTKKFHHLAPDYLERRQRLRRKSGGTLLTDILKPPRMRKAQKRSMDGDESSIGGADDLISRNSTESDLASIVSLGSQADFNQSPKVSIGRSTSFRTAVRSRPLHSESFEDSLPSSPITQSPSSTPTRRSKSFKIATRFKPLIASETTSLPSSPSLPTAKIGFGGNSGSTPDFCDESSDQVFSDELKVRPKHLSLSNSGKFSSMPVLNATEKAQNRKSDVTVSPKLSSGSFNFGNVNQSPKKVIDVRQYFSRNKENNPSISSLTDIEENQNLRKEAKSVSAFHDTFLRKSTENLQKSPKIVRKAITLTRPLSVKNVLNKAYSSDIGRVPPATVEDPWIYNPNVASKENIPRDVHETEKKSQPLGRNRHQRTRSYGGELDDYPNGNFDWIVYANRNSLPVTGLSSEEMRRYQNYYSQSRDASASYQNSIDDMSHERQSETEREQDNVLSFCDDSEPSISKNSYNEDRNQNNVFHTLSNRTLDNELSALGSLPMVNKPPDSCVVQCRKQVKVSRSNSTPCTRPDKYLMFGRHNRTQSVDVTGLNDPDQLLAEMEDYMKRSDSTITLFPLKQRLCHRIIITALLDRNLNYQQCDSAFSIDLGGDSSSTSEESPRVVEESPSIAYVEQREVPGPPSLKKADSFYEKRLSMAFNDSEFFRDSAVYCDIDFDNQPLSPSTSTPTDVKPPRLPIKEYVQKLEEKHRKKFPETTKVKVREPGDVIKQRLESLQNYSQRRSQSCSRPGSEEREFSGRSSSSSRSVSVDREVGPHRFSLVNFDHNFGEPIGKTKGELFRSYGRENSEPDFRGRSRSRSKSPGGTLKSASSMGRLDQLSTDVENLVIMKGWVKQLIDKFQPSTTDT
ncbi:hypothetical protein FSP39_003724 [Pinctada imbricata]|uniref:Uncharacterized protein n=1 Tax=Pinctada imbricata TaxID=66713 RepID=A0AA89C2W1_PINIB|nr:hypothetical protein FSP39_003724 [Pinctada imbricata]